MSTNGIAALNEFIMGVCVDTLSFQILHVLSYSFFFFSWIFIVIVFFVSTLHFVHRSATSDYVGVISKLIIVHE